MLWGRLGGACGRWEGWFKWRFALDKARSLILFRVFLSWTFCTRIMADESSASTPSASTTTVPMPSTSTSKSKFAYSSPEATNKGALEDISEKSEHSGHSESENERKKKEKIKQQQILTPTPSDEETASQQAEQGYESAHEYQLLNEEENGGEGRSKGKGKARAPTDSGVSGLGNSTKHIITHLPEHIASANSSREAELSTTLATLTGTTKPTERQMVKWARRDPMAADTRALLEGSAVGVGWGVVKARAASLNDLDADLGLDLGGGVGGLVRRFEGLGGLGSRRMGTGRMDFAEGDLLTRESPLGRFLTGVPLRPTPNGNAASSESYSIGAARRRSDGPGTSSQRPELSLLPPRSPVTASRPDSSGPNTGRTDNITALPAIPGHEHNSANGVSLPAESGSQVNLLPNPGPRSHEPAATFINRLRHPPTNTTVERISHPPCTPRGPSTGDPEKGRHTPKRSTSKTTICLRNLPMLTIWIVVLLVLIVAFGHVYRMEMKKENEGVGESKRGRAVEGDWRWFNATREWEVRHPEGYLGVDGTAITMMVQTSVVDGALGTRTSDRIVGTSSVYFSGNTLATTATSTISVGQIEASGNHGPCATLASSAIPLVQSQATFIFMKASSSSSHGQTHGVASSAMPLVSRSTSSAHTTSTVALWTQGPSTPSSTQPRTTSQPNQIAPSTPIPTASNNNVPPTNPIVISPPHTPISQTLSTHIPQDTPTPNPYSTRLNNTYDIPIPNLNLTHRQNPENNIWSLILQPHTHPDNKSTTLTLQIAHKINFAPLFPNKYATASSTHTQSAAFKFMRYLFATCIAAAPVVAAWVLATHASRERGGMSRFLIPIVCVGVAVVAAAGVAVGVEEVVWRVVGGDGGMRRMGG